ncbi:hypothetical protein NDU88_001130 [Pleurodeles waltl]|uniref:Secreted protein n=1 Tax=Pleurodeles waltl TaxID=8319 RepID=A0AAV7WJJ8_PLEWA|nr:hypothetical protein NDU88_001130 [Pleurodeles waltl]
MRLPGARRVVPAAWSWSALVVAGATAFDAAWKTLPGGAAVVVGATYMQIPDDPVVFDHGTCQSVTMGSGVQNSGDHFVVEPITSRPGLAGSVISSRGDGPYNLRPHPQCSTRLRGFVLN